MFRPSGRFLVANVAVPPRSPVFARVVAPSRKETSPVGVPPCGDETVALNVTDSPNAEGFAEEVNLVAVSSKPIPVRSTVCGLSGALSVMLTTALRFPAAKGVKVAVMEQLVPTGTDVPQLFVWAKSPLFVPMTLMDLMVNVSPPALVRVETRGPLVMPIG